jgi:lipopolysaccharide heptosyltransferase I
MRILIVKLSSIGDVVHALPAASLLRRAIPFAHISWVVERRASAILMDSPVIDRLIEIDTRAWRRRWSKIETVGEIRGLISDLRESDTGIDIAIDFQGLIKSGLVALASGAGQRIGFETGELRERASRIFLTEQVETSSLAHVIEKNLALARAAIGSSGGSDSSLPVASGPFEFPIAVSPEDERYIDIAVAQTAGRFAIINPGGGWPTKLWPASAYGEIADWLAREYNLPSFITYGPGEEVLAKEVASSARTDGSRLLATTLKQFVALARRASLFVGGDTGPLHLAAASGTPIVGLYGPTAPERNGPFDRRDYSLGRDLWCREGCHRRSCWHWECMAIPVSAVRHAISKRLALSERETQWVSDR